MLKLPPKFTFCGLTIIMSNPSRMDDKELLSGTAGWFFKEVCLKPEVNIFQCDVRLIDDPRPLLPGTKVILLLGQIAHKKFTKANTTLDENRGSPIIIDGIPCISTFSPQDAMDLRNYEMEKNQWLKEYIEEEFETDEREAGDIFESKSRTRTARANYRFWLKVDVKKALKILENKGQLPAPLIKRPDYHIWPSSEEIISLLESRKNDTLHIDIETDFVTLDIRCIAFAFESTPSIVYVVPIFRAPDYAWAYSNLPHIFRAFCSAFKNNTTVAHN